jgi:hypothetical protein
MYQESGLAWLERQAEAAEDLLAERQAADHPEGPTGTRPPALHLPPQPLAAIGGALACW